MLKRDIHLDERAISIRLKKLRLALEAGLPFLSRSDQLIFLCGANRSDGTPSARRTAIHDFISSQDKNFRVVYAELVFNELAKLSGTSKKNVLDLEHQITEIADKIVIVLESPSSFCELGAFAYPTLRDRLIVINDKAFKHEKSFINTGPIAALQEVKSPTLWYPMSSNGLNVLDGIGQVFFELSEALLQKNQSPASKNHKRIEINLRQLAATKECLYFVHDLILFTGPIAYDELIEVMKAVFGDGSYDNLKWHIGVLRSARLIAVNDHGSQGRYFTTTSPEPYMTYAGIHLPSLVGAFRSYHLKVDPGRFKK